MAPEDREYIKTLLLRIEQSIHRKGWDQEPWIGTLSWLRSDVLGVGKIEMEIHNPPGHFIEWLGKIHMEDPNIPQALLDQTRGTYYGSVFVCEGWSHEEKDPNKLKEIRDSGKSLADIVGSREIRMIQAVDAWGRTYSVHRVRGEKPLILQDKVGVQAVGGRVIEGLRRITLSCVNLMPDHEEQQAALKALLVRDLEDMVDEFAETKASPNA